MTNNFEIRGFWWLPEDESKKVPGVLDFVADKEIKLELMGSFYESPEQANKSEGPQFFRIILVESEGVKYTLLKSQEAKTKIIDSNGTAFYIQSSIHCGYIIKGIHFLSLEDIKFAQINVNFTYLEDWLNPRPFKWENMNTVKYVAPPERHIKIEKINSDVSIVSAQSTSNNFKTFSMSFKSFFIIKPKSESKVIEWYEDVIGCLGNFLTLVIGKPVYPLAIEAFLPKNYKIDIYFALNNILLDKEIHFSQMMISYNNLTSYLDKFLNNWFKYSDTLDPVYELFFGTYYAQLYVHFYFLSLIQAIEAFHRRIYEDKGKYLFDVDYELLRISLTNSVPLKFPDGRNYPAGLRDALKNKIKYGNEYSLRTRLKQMSNDIWGPLDPLLYENKNKFNNYVVCTRNYLTHYENDPDCRVFRGKELININLVLQSIFLVTMLTHMGVPKLDAFRIVKRHNGRALAKALNEIFQEEVGQQ
jgi:hypothetical protein